MIGHDGHAIPPLPSGRALRDVIAYRRSLLPPVNRDDPTFKSSAWWTELLQQEQEDAVQRQAYPPPTRPHNTGRRYEFWEGLDIDDVLRRRGYRPYLSDEPARHAFFGGPVTTRAEAEEEEEEEVDDEADYHGLLAWEAEEIAAEEAAEKAAAEAAAALMPPGIGEEEALALAEHESVEEAQLAEERQWVGTFEALAFQPSRRRPEHRHRRHHRRHRLRRRPLGQPVAAAGVHRPRRQR
jgi:hypothetical protein